MKQFFDYFPVLVFVIVYFTGKDMILATKALIVASVIQIAAFWLWKRSVEKLHLITLLVVLVMGGLTIALNDPIYIIWKPTVIHWIVAAVLLGSILIGKNLVRKLVEGFMRQAPHLALDLPDNRWAPLGLTWVAYFVLQGVVNLYVAYNYDEETWVTFKLVGSTIMNVIFFAGQFIYLSRFTREVEAKAAEDDPL